MRPVHALAAVALAIVAASCAVDIRDRTGALGDSPPLNEQVFRVEAAPRGAGVVVDAVSVAVDSMPALAMTPSTPADHYSASVRLEPCQAVVEYTFRVRYGSSASSGRGEQRAPASGVFRQPITGLPASCATDPPERPGRTFSVNTTADLADAAPGDGVCNALTTSAPAQCSLRAAIMEANASPGPDMILLALDRYVLSRARPAGAAAETDAVADAAFGDLDVTEALTLRGRSALANTPLVDALRYGATVLAADIFKDDPDDNRTMAKIDGAGIDRVLQVHASAGRVRFEDLIVVGGRAIDRAGGGIHNAGGLALARVGVVGNRLASTGGGGGVFSPNRGAGVFNAGRIDASEVALLRNEVEGGTGFAGGWFNDAGAVARIERSLIAFNVSRFASAFYDSEPETGRGAARLELNASTIALNTNDGSPFGAVVNSGTAQLVFVTIADNRGGGLSASGATTVEHALFANHVSSDHCRGSLQTNFGRSVYDNVGPTECRRSGAGADSDRVGVPLIVAGSLSQVSGFTPVYRILPRRDAASTLFFAVDAIDDSGSPLCPTATDQRGVPRPVDGDSDGTAFCDPGAYEYQPTDVPR